MTAGMIGASNSVGTMNLGESSLKSNYEMNSPVFDSIRKSNLEKTLDISGEFNIPEHDSIPALAKFKLNSLSCAKYVQKAAQKYYGEVDSFPQRDSWNMRYASTIVAKFKEKDKYQELNTLREEGILRPGMILGVYNPRSAYNDTLDEKGNKAKYTHVLIYVGKDKKGNLIFDNQWDEKTLRVDTKWLKKKGLKPVEILDPLGKLSYMAVGIAGYKKNPRPSVNIFIYSFF